MTPYRFSLALGGGWARWLAHIGVLRFFEEKGLFPHALSGTSMGAIIATLIALGKKSRDIEMILDSVELLSLVDFDMKKWVIAWEKLEAYFEKLFEGKAFRDTRMPLFITATDINIGEGRVFHEGKLSKAVRASIGLPGIFPPFDHENQELVDGGLTANLPIELLPKGRVIAVSAMRDLSRKIVYKRKIFSLDWQNSIFTNSYNIMQKTIDIMLSQNESRSLQSRDDIIMIRPSFDSLDYYEFHKYREFIQSGYEKAKEVLPEDFF
jgi:NTE family protein